MAIDFVNIFSELEAMGFFDIILPFLLVFTIVFAVINKTQILGGKRNIDVIIGFVIALLAVRSEFFVELMKSFLPNVAMFMIVILMFLMMFGIFAGEKKDWTRVPLVLGALISFVFILFALLFDYTDRYVSFPDWLRDLFYGMDDSTKGIILFLGITVIIIWLLVGKKTGGGFKDIAESFAKGLRGEP